MMKKLLMAVVMMATSLAVSAQEATDMEKRDNGLYIPTTYVKPGDKGVELSVCMKNADGVQTIGNDVYLPAGVTVAEEDGDLLVDLSIERTTYKNHSLACAMQKDGALRTGILQQRGKTFTDNDGEVYIITVNIADDMAEGQYLIKIAGQEFSSLKPKVIPEDTYSILWVSNTITGVNEVAADAAVAPKKVVKDGKVIIVKDGKEYNANGAELK